MNIRARQICKAVTMRENPDLIASLQSDDGPWLRVIFVPVSEVQEYKAKYGDRLRVWFEDDEEAGT